MKNNQDVIFDKQSKIAYYKGRVDDVNLTDGQRRYAAGRLSALCGSGKGKSTVPAPSRSSNSSKFTDPQKYAYGAGIGYGAAKTGKRVDVRDENKSSFRDGYKKGKAYKSK